ncbi:hypothetical protein HYH03_010567 [Edaphochlamys debaryana]|uniref:Uncharacterized protein n=1 Tax=Edaphochlamys debaryana TaxID=47281 RepID=A0A835XY18_9CHLO|nr:hypothetical protein HYH03_010567 [Edaphochlamys debaryana]|eukprot:KAG2491123.1 hypothetical protein HYH03_010567 [Edaphochlamys debaryana]
MALLQPSPLPGARGAATNPVDLNQDDEEEEVEAELECIGTSRTRVVGCRYYNGLASKNEMVLLIREPQNPYDRWAIRVDNVRGEKIGHIGREQAAVLSPLIDKGDLKIEGVVQGEKGAFTMPIDLLCWATPAAADAVEQRLIRGGIALGAGRGRGAGGAGGGAGAGRGAVGARASYTVSRVAALTPRELETSLERMFNEVHAKSTVQPAMEPHAEVLSRLYPHQRVALAWMVARENGSDLPPFWQARTGPGGGYTNTLTNFVSTQKPEPLRGGILADDMGLGKTLILISLIASNRPGTPLPPLSMLDLAAPDPTAPPDPSPAAAGPSGAAPAGVGAGPSGSGAGPSSAGAGPSGAGSGAVAPAQAQAQAGPRETLHRGRIVRAKPEAKPQAKGKAAKGRGKRAQPDSDDDEEEDDEDEGGEEDDDYVPTPAKGRKAQPKAARGRASKGRGKRGRAASDDDEEEEEDEEVVPPPAKKRGAAPKAAATAAAAAPSAAGARTAAAAAAPSAAHVAALAAGAPKADGPRGTLVVCPVSVLSNWATQLQEHTAGGLKVYAYHGPERSRSPQLLAQQDVVLTTYQMLASDLADGRGLLSVRWLRVVLDEAHTIKNPKAKMSQAAAKLKAERKWAVTGTPIQNRMADLYGLLAFLRLEPLQERSIFNRTLQRPLQAGDRDALLRLQVLMAAIALRRTKDLKIGGRPLVSLPDRCVNLVRVHLTRDDRAKYDALELAGRQLVSQQLAASTLLENYMGVLEIILRLRQVSDAGCLVAAGPLPLSIEAGTAGGAAGGGAGRGRGAAPPLTEEERTRLLELLTGGLQDDCPICLEPLSASACITRCKHAFCRPCLEHVIAAAAGPGCPMCRAPLSLAELVDLPPDTSLERSTQAGTDVDDPCAASAKVAALMEQLRAAAALPPDGHGPLKSVVFSQFTGMLNLVEKALNAAEVPFVRLDGSTPASARADMVKSFASRQPGSPVVFLASLKAGGVGMNLTAASHVHLLDPWWNPAVEEQAMDRVHRLGQVRGVQVYRYVAADTIEERMLQLQDRKRQLAAAAFDKRSAEESRRMRVEDVRLLMAL